MGIRTEYDYSQAIGHSEDFRPELLTRLHALLLADADNEQGVKFHLGTWAEPAGHRRWELELMKGEATLPVSCGTQACAFGLAAISGIFASEGLTTHWVQHGSSVMLHPVLTDDYGDVRGDMDAAVKLFGISMEDAQYLFDPGCYDGDTPVEAEGERIVAERIRLFIAGKVDAACHRDFDQQPYDGCDD